MIVVIKNKGGIRNSINQLYTLSVNPSYNYWRKDVISATNADNTLTNTQQRECYVFLGTNKTQNTPHKKTRT